jgi:hypothetical protein
MQYQNPPPGGPGYPQTPSPYAGGPPGYPPPGAWGPPPGPVCPRCHGPNVRKPSWTWWGGFLGPKMINHWQCGNCNFGFNPTTGRSTSGAIGIYFAVSFAIAIVLGVMFFMMRRY